MLLFHKYQFISGFLLFFLANGTIASTKKESPPQVQWTLQADFEHYPTLATPSFQPKWTPHNIIIYKLGLNYLKKTQRYKNHVDLSILHITSDQGVYWDPTQAYLSKTLSNDWTITLGRKKFMWNWADQFMDRNFWQPGFNWNFIRKKTQGLTGFFLQSPETKKGFQWIFFASPVFLPNNDFKTRYHKKRPICHSPWCKPAQQHIDILGQSTPMNYTLSHPPTKDFFFKFPGMATKIQWKKKAFNLASSMAYKPSNMLYFYYPISMDISPSQSNDFQLTVDINAKTIYNFLWSQEFEYHLGSWDFKFDWTYSYLRTPSMGGKKNILAQNYTSTNVYTVLLSKKIESHSLSPEFFLGHSYIDSEVMQEVGDFAMDDQQVLPLRYRFVNTTLFGIRHFLSPFFHSKVKSDFEIGHDWKQNGLLIKTSIGFQWTQDFLSYLQWDMLKLTKGDHSQQNYGWFYQYVQNDTLRIGARYDF